MDDIAVPVGADTGVLVMAGAHLLEGQGDIIHSARCRERLGWPLRESAIERVGKGQASALAHTARRRVVEEVHRNNLVAARHDAKLHLLRVGPPSIHGSVVPGDETARIREKGGEVTRSKWGGRIVGSAPEPDDKCRLRGGG